jgi:hypothetical protein
MKKFFDDEAIIKTAEKRQKLSFADLAWWEAQHDGSKVTRKDVDEFEETEAAEKDVQKVADKGQMGTNKAGNGSS